MRIRLRKNKQRELILTAKGEGTWNDLAGILRANAQYLSNELKNEKMLLSESMYYKLCEKVGINYDDKISDRLEKNWGRSKGGLNSKGNTKDLIYPKEGKLLAELIGIILGDGHLGVYKKGKKIRCYSVVVSGDSVGDNHYLTNFVSNIIEKLFNEVPKIGKSKRNNGMFIVLHGKKLTEFFISKGLKSGNKKKNNQNIPKWILENDEYLKVCLRGLIDTDGSVHYISRYNKNLRICYTSYIPNLMRDVRLSFIKFGFHPSKIIKGNQFFLTRKEDIRKYISEIGFSNQKHLNRLKNLSNNALMV